MKNPNLPILWKRGALWLVFLGPFFFLGYGWLNVLTSKRADVGIAVESWEHAIPFVPWMMLPYMSIDAFYAASLFLFRKRSALDRHALRLLLATVISLAGFWLFPLQFSFAVPKAEGFNGFLQAVLLGFDKPYNQAPSLHISLLLVLWVVYAKRLQGFWRLALHTWFLAIGASVLLVYQHHFLDVWTGALVGVACLYLIPDRPFFWRKKPATKRMSQLVIRYALGASLALVTALLVHTVSGFLTLVLAWVAMALALVAAAYTGFEKHVFQRHQGVMRWPARMMLAPYLLGSWLSYRFYTQHRLQPNQIHHHVWLGAFPNQAVAQMGWGAVLDLTSEFTATHAQHGIKHKYLPIMDLTPPSPKVLVNAVRWLDREQHTSKVLVHCALGLSRSASVVVCWLVWQQHAANIPHAIAIVNAKRSGIVLSPAHVQQIADALNTLNQNA